MATGYFTEEMILKKLDELFLAHSKAIQAESYSTGDGQTSVSISRASVSDIQSQINWWVLKLESVCPNKYKTTKDIWAIQSNLGRINNRRGF